MLTIEQKKAYLEDPTICPYCKSGDIAGEQFEVEGEIATQETNCAICGGSWQVTYRQESVEELECPPLLEKREEPKEPNGFQELWNLIEAEP
jgi:hypothetical protein